VNSILAFAFAHSLVSRDFVANFGVLCKFPAKGYVGHDQQASQVGLMMDKQKPKDYMT
jgi:hypothetical protein